jgi:regulator of sigma E protease
MLTVVAFIVTLGILVTVHEYGHFQMARWCGVKVLKFSIGFGKPLFSKVLGQDKTEFILAAIPLGGYVKMLDEREQEAAQLAEYSPAELQRAFNRQAVWKRSLIVVAGPLANLLLAVLLYWVLMMHGVMGLRAVVGDVPASSAAMQAGLLKGDLIMEVNHAPIKTWQDVRWELMQQALHTGPVELTVQARNQQRYLRHLSMAKINRDDFEGDFLAKLGLEPYQPALPAKIGSLVADSAASKAGLHTGDLIVSAQGQAITLWQDFVKIVRASPDKAIPLQVQRAGQILAITVVPEATTEQGVVIGRIGAAMDQAALDEVLTTVQYAPLPALQKAFAKTWDTSTFSLKMLAGMVTGDVSLKGISGPVTIASYAGQSAQLGLAAFIGFLALVSISLGVLNLLPIPVLDGGHLLYYMLEVVKGSPVSQQAMEFGQRVGLSLLGLMMACALYNDFNRLITG